MTGPSRASPRQRIAWLLRVNRLLGAGQWARTSAFVRAFRGGCWSGAASESTVSRWETGQLRVPYLAVRRYEELLDLPPGLLVAVIDTLNRYSAPVLSGPPQLDRGAEEPTPERFDQLEELIERARSDSAMSGWQWDELTGRLCALPNLVLVPRHAWAELAERLLLETVAADGLSWMQRFEALCRLLAHPRGQVAAVSAIQEMVRDPATVVYIEPMSALDASPHPNAGQFVLDQLTGPVNERAQYGALLATVRKIRYGHFTPAQLTGLVPVLGELLGQADGDGDIRRLAADVLRRLPAAAQNGVAGRLRQALVNDRAVAQVLAEGRLATTATARIVVSRMVEVAAGNLPAAHGSFREELLPVLLDELLYSPIVDIRLYAAMLIYATPYRSPVAATLAIELMRAASGADLALAGAILDGLRFIGEAAQRPLIEQLLTAQGLSPRVRLAAAHNIGHIGGRSDARFWRTVIGLHGGRWQRERDPVSATVLNGLVYGLGIARERAMLAAVAEDQAVPDSARAAATWWLNLPTAVWAS